MRKLSLVVICLAIVAVAGCGKKGQFVNLPPGATLDTSQPVQQQQPGFQPQQQPQPPVRTPAQAEQDETTIESHRITNAISQAKQDDEDTAIKRQQEELYRKYR